MRWSTTFLERHLPPGSSCLDVGCAAGDLSAELARRGHRVFAVDIAHAMVARARERLEPLGVPRDHVLACGSSSLPFADDSFDLVSALTVLPYVEDQPPYVRELRRVLRPGGLMMIAIKPRSSPFRMIEAARALRRRRSWPVARNLLRTGLSSGGYVSAEAEGARSAQALDRLVEDEGLRRIDWFGEYGPGARWDGDPLKRGRLGRVLARRLAWTYAALYTLERSS